jgi:hypothetical protein
MSSFYLNVGSTARCRAWRPNLSFCMVSSNTTLVTIQKQNLMSNNEHVVQLHRHLLKRLASRLHSSIHDISRRRRACTSGASHTSKYAIGQAKKRTTNQSKASSACVYFTVATVLTAPPDVEMDGTGASTSYFSSPRSILISLSRTLG